MSLLRHLMTAASGYLVAKGFADAAVAEALVGGVLAAAGIAWSWFKHRAQPQLPPPAPGDTGA